MALERRPFTMDIPQSTFESNQPWPVYYILGGISLIFHIVTKQYYGEHAAMLSILRVLTTVIAIGPAIRSAMMAHTDYKKRREWNVKIAIAAIHIAILLVSILCVWLIKDSVLLEHSLSIMSFILSSGIAVPRMFSYSNNSSDILFLIPAFLKATYIALLFNGSEKKYQHLSSIVEGMTAFICVLYGLFAKDAQITSGDVPDFFLINVIAAFTLLTSLIYLPPCIKGISFLKVLIEGKIKA